MWPETAKSEERLMKALLLGCIGFFVLAGLAVPDNARRHAQRGNQSWSLSQAERLLLQQLKEQIYSDLFVRSRLCFKLRTEAMGFLNFDPLTRKRKPHCGRWMTNVKPLVLKVMGLRCAPLVLA